MKTYKKIIPLLDREFERGDAYLAELSQRARNPNDYSSAISDWLNLN